jgi:ectoine hydroxylase-related dioxygenase (phytanoyl-CoA dioxygenase family)
MTGPSSTGVSLRVVELTREPGNVVLVRCDCFHAAAPNRLTQPRMMLTGMAAPNRGEQIAAVHRSRLGGPPAHRLV